MDIHWNTKKRHSNPKIPCCRFHTYYFWYLHLKKLDIQLFSYLYIAPFLLKNRLHTLLELSLFSIDKDKKGCYYPFKERFFVLLFLSFIFYLSLSFSFIYNFFTTLFLFSHNIHSSFYSLFLSIKYYIL